MSRASWQSSDTPRIRAAIVAIAGSAPLSARQLHERVAARTGLQIGERRFYRALRRLAADGRVRRVRPETWRDTAGYVRVMGRPAAGRAA